MSFKLLIEGLSSVGRFCFEEYLLQENDNGK